MDILEILFFAIVVGGGWAFRIINKKNKATRQVQKNNQAGSGATPVDEKSKLKGLLEKLEMLEEGNHSQKLGQPGMPVYGQQQATIQMGQGANITQQQGVAKRQQQGPNQIQKQAQVKAQEEARRKEQEQRELKARQQLEINKRKALAKKEAEEQEILPRVGLGLDSREQLVRGIIISEILGPPKALKR
jgi:hypothetical protein